MPKYVIELFKGDETILARSARNVPLMNRAELREWAQEVVQKYSAVRSVSGIGPQHRYMRVLCVASYCVWR